MKKLLISLCMLFVSAVCQAQGYIEAQAGAVINPQAAFGVRGGAELGSWDVSVGYWTSHDAPVSDSGLLANRLTLNTVDIEAYNVIPLKNGLSFRLGGGAGYTMPEFNNEDKADNDYSFVVGGGLDYRIRPSLSIGILARRFFFNTDTRRTTYASHMETLSTGQEVEVSDQVDQHGSVSLDGILVTAGIKYLF